MKGIYLLTLSVLLSAKVQASSKIQLPTFAQSADVGSTISDIGEKIVNLGYIIAGVVFTVAIIYSGIIWMMSDDKGEEAKAKIRNAILGGVVVSSGVAIATFIFK